MVLQSECDTQGTFWGGKTALPTAEQIVSRFGALSTILQSLCICLMA